MWENVDFDFGGERFEISDFFLFHHRSAEFPFVTQVQLPDRTSIFLAGV